MLLFWTLSIWMSIWIVGNADQSTCPLDSYFDGTYCISCNGLECGPGLEPVTYSNGTCACQACKPGSYSEHYGGQPCRKCSECQEGMFKVLDCWVDRDTLCSLCPRGYFLVTPTFDCKKCSCCCNGFAPQPECLEQGLPSSQACVRDLACECNDTIVVTAPTHTYHQPNATIRVTWPQDTPAAATDAHLTAVFILGSLVGILIIIIVLGICYIYKLKRRRRDFQAMLETPVQEIGASEYLVSPPTVYSELESDTEVFAAHEIQVEEEPLHCLYEADICCDREFTPLMSVGNEMTTMASSPLPLDSSHEKEKYPLVSSLPENNQLTDRGRYKALPVAAQTKKIRWLDSSRLESLKKRLQQDNDLEKVLSYFRSTLPMPIDCGGGFDPWSFLSVRGKTLEDLHNGLLDLDLVNAARMLRAAVEDQLRSLESNSGSTDVTFPKVVEDGQKALWMQSANPSSVESYPFPVDTGAVSPSQVPSSYKECDTPLHEDTYTHSKSQDLSQGIVFGASLGPMDSQQDEKVHGKLIGDQPKMANIADSLLDTTRLLGPGDVPSQTSDTRQSVEESPQDFGEPEKSVGEQPEACSNVDSLLGPGDVPSQTSDARQSVEESPQVFEEPEASVGEQPEACSSVDSLLGPDAVPRQTLEDRGCVISRECDSYLIAAVGVGGFGLMANGALMIHVFDDTPDDQIELIRRRVKVGFKFSGDVSIEKIQDEIAIREQTLPVNAHSSAVSGGHSDTVGGTLPVSGRPTVREQEGMGPGGRIYTNNPRMEALETILDSSDEFAGLGINGEYLYVLVDDKGVAPEDFNTKCQMIRQKAKRFLDERVKVTKMSFLPILNLDWYFSREADGVDGISKINGEGTYVLEFKRTDDMDENRTKSIEVDRILHEELEYTDDFKWERNEGDQSMSRVSFFFTLADDPKTVYAATVFHVLHPYTFSLYGNPSINRNWLSYRDDLSKLSRKPIDKERQFFDEDGRLFGTAYAGLYSNAGADSGNDLLVIRVDDEYPHMSLKSVIDRDQSVKNHDGKEKEFDVFSGTGKDLMDYNRGFVMLRGSSPSLNGSACESQNVFLKYVSVSRDKKEVSSPMFLVSFNPESQPGDSGATVCWADKYHSDVFLVSMHVRKETIGGKAYSGSYRIDEAIAAIEKDIFPNKKVVHYLVDKPSKCSLNSQSRDDSGAENVLNTPSNGMLNSQHNSESAVGSESFTPLDSPLTSPDADDSGIGNVSSTSSNGLLDSQPDNQSVVGSVLSTPLDSPVNSPDADDSGVGNVSSTPLDGLLDSQPDYQSAVGSVLSTPLDSPVNSPDADDSGVENCI